MKKIIRLTERDLTNLIKRIVIEERYMNEGEINRRGKFMDMDEREEKYGSFGNMKRKDYRGDKYVSDDEIFGIGDDDEFDTEEFDDFDSYSERYPEEDEDSPSWFKGKQGRTMFDRNREMTGKPLKVKTRKPKMEENYRRYRRY